MSDYLQNLLSELQSMTIEEEPMDLTKPEGKLPPPGMPQLVPAFVAQNSHPQQLKGYSMSVPPAFYTNKKRPLDEMMEEVDGDCDEKDGPNDQKKRRSKLPLRAILIFRKWFTEHVRHPYPTPAEKKDLAREAGLSTKQTNNWFTNTRKRFWVPYMNKLKAQQQLQMARGLVAPAALPPTQEELFSES